MSLPEHKMHIEENIDERSAAAWAHKFHVPNQNFVVMSIVDKGSPPAAVKVFGTFGTVEEANKVSDQIANENDFFDVYVANTDVWLPVPCDRDFVESVKYQEDKMNDIRDAFCAISKNNAKRLADTIKQDMQSKQERAKQVADTVASEAADQQNNDGD